MLPSVAGASSPGQPPSIVAPSSFGSSNASSSSGSGSSGSNASYYQRPPSSSNSAGAGGGYALPLHQSYQQQQQLLSLQPQPHHAYHIPPRALNVSRYAYTECARAHDDLPAGVRGLLEDMRVPNTQERVARADALSRCVFVSEPETNHTAKSIDSPNSVCIFISSCRSTLK